MPYHQLHLPQIRQNVSRPQKLSPIDRKQSETVKDCVSISFFSHFCVTTRRKQYIKIEFFLSLAFCLRSLAIIGDWSGMNVKGVSIYANCLRSCKLSEGVCDSLRRSYAHMETRLRCGFL